MALASPQSPFGDSASSLLYFLPTLLKIHTEKFGCYNFNSAKYLVAIYVRGQHNDTELKNLFDLRAVHMRSRTYACSTCRDEKCIGS